MTLIWGYARASMTHQECSPEIQEARFLERLKRGDIPGQLAEVVKEHASAVEIRWNKRPGFSRLMQMMQEGDQLLVWRLDRLDRSFYGVIAAADWLLAHKIKVRSLEERGGHELELDSLAGKAFLMAMALGAEMSATHLKEATAAGRKWRKENGLAYCKNPGFGRRRAHRNGKKYDVWDEDECRQIREIYQRYKAGESIPRIGMDFYLRGERTAAGRPWVRYNGKKHKLPDYYRLYEVLKWYSALLKSGKDLGDPQPLGHRATVDHSPPVAELEL